MPVAKKAAGVAKAPAAKKAPPKKVAPKNEVPEKIVEALEKGANVVVAGGDGEPVHVKGVGVVAKAVAEAKAQPVGDGDGEVHTDFQEDFEAAQAQYRKVKRPVWEKVKAWKWVVLMSAWLPDKFGEEPDNIADRDFQGAPTVAEAQQFFDAQCEWAVDDVDSGEDPPMRHAVMLLQTDPLKIVNLSVFGGDEAWRKRTHAAIKADYTLMLTQNRREAGTAKPKAAAAKKVPKKAEVVEKRQPKEAAKEVLAAARAAKPPREPRVPKGNQPVAKEKVDEFFANREARQAKKGRALVDAFVGAKKK